MAFFALDARIATLSVWWRSVASGAAFVRAVGPGGGWRAPDMLASEIMLLKRVAALAMLCEFQEAKLLRGEDIDTKEYRLNAKVLKEMMVSLGLVMKARDVTKQDYKRPEAPSAAILELEEE